MAISNGKYCITKGVNDKNVKLVETFEKCKLPDAVNEIMTSNDYCIISGKCENGITVNVKVNDDEEYNFFCNK